MVKMNDMMNEILKAEEETKSCLQIDNIVREIVSKTRIIRDCLVYDKDGILKEKRINFNRIIQFVGDWTGYEVSCNELRFDRKSIHSNQFLVLVSRLSDMLSQKFNGRKIVVYILLCENEIELRFHTYRKDESLWLDKDLNKYDMPILCWI